MLGENKKVRAAKLKKKAIGVFDEAVKELDKANELLHTQEAENLARRKQHQTAIDVLDEENKTLETDYVANNNLIEKLQEFTTK